MMDTHKKKKGFACLPTGVVQRIASLGGIAAHAKGTAHEWTKETARIAGRKGGLVVQERRRREQAALKTAIDTLPKGCA